MGNDSVFFHLKKMNRSSAKTFCRKPFKIHSYRMLLLNAEINDYVSLVDYAFVKTLQVLCCFVFFFHKCPSVLRYKEKGIYGFISNTHRAILLSVFWNFSCPSPPFFPIERRKRKKKQNINFPFNTNPTYTEQYILKTAPITYS